MYVHPKLRLDAIFDIDIRYWKRRGPCGVMSVLLFCGLVYGISTINWSFFSPSQLYIGVWLVIWTMWCCRFLERPSTFLRSSSNLKSKQLERFLNKVRISISSDPSSNGQITKTTHGLIERRKICMFTLYYRLAVGLLITAQLLFVSLSH